VGAELIQAETDRQTDMTQLISAFRAFISAPNETKHMPEKNRNS